MVSERATPACFRTDLGNAIERFLVRRIRVFLYACPAVSVILLGPSEMPGSWSKAVTRPAPLSIGVGKVLLSSMITD